MSEQGPPEIAVVGSINLDLSLSVDRLPDPGETVIGRDVVQGGGGKGANQAVAAARLGRQVAMVGRVGADDGGAHLVGLLADEGIDVTGVAVTEQVPSGLAVIEVDAAGENRIVVISGANAEVGPGDVEAASSALAAAPVVLTQFEIPLEAIAALAALPREGLLVVNPAPAVTGVDLAGVDVLVPNRGELAMLAGAGGVPATVPATVDEVVDQVVAIGADLRAAVVTLGADGALVVDRPGTDEMVVTEVPPVAVTPIDTTAAGDSFCGALADALCLGAEIVEAASWAARVAAITVTRRGAQDSLPTRSDVLS